MPFDEEEDQQSVQSQKLGLKKVSTQKSIFDNMPKKRSQEELNEKVAAAQKRAGTHKVKAMELASQFNKILADKTLPQNRNMFQKEVEKELLGKMVQLAADINNDPNEQFDGMGSLGWITLLLRTCFNQRDKINLLEYRVEQLEKKSDPDLVSKEIAKALDALKKSE